MLDIDHGTYPFVTSSNATSGGVATGLGVAPTRITGVVGVTKAYTTRVGSGPFPTEMPDLDAQEVRTRGNEFGAVTGRPRRCGWLDLVVLRYAMMLNGIDSLVVTKLDVFDTQSEIQVCTGYRYKGSRVKEMPPDVETLAQIEPEYKTLPGWRKPTPGIRDVEGFAERGARLPEFHLRPAAGRNRHDLHRPGARRDNRPARNETRLLVVERMLSFEAARAKVIEVIAARSVISPETEIIDIVEEPARALGRVLAEDVIADRNYPPFDRSTRDGYALRAADVAHAGREVAPRSARAAREWPSTALCATANACGS